MRRTWTELAAPIFVGAVFVAMLAAGIVYVACYASVVPFWDDLGWTVVLANDSPLGWDWWWSAHNEHRIPLPRAILVPLLRATHDFRAGMYFEVLLLGALALGMILVARRLRGRTSCADAFFPLLWLSWGNAENLMILHAVSQVLGPAILSLFVMRIATLRGSPRVRDALLLGACVFSLPLCGGHGLTLVPPLILWMLGAGWSSLRASDRAVRRAGTVLCAFAAATLVLLTAYFLGFRNHNLGHYTHSPVAIAERALRFLALAIGPAARDAWPLSGWATGIGLLLGLVLVAHVLRTRPAERLRATAFLAAGAGIVAMALSVGIARGGLDADAAFADRYVSVPTPLLCCAFLASCLWCRPVVRNCVCFGLCGLMFVLLPHDVRAGISHGERRRAASERFLADLSAGLSIRELALRHWERFSLGPRIFELGLTQLHDAGIEPFARARKDAADARYPMFKTAPRSVVSTREVGERRIGEEYVLLVHPPCELRFDLAPGARTVAGRYGMHPLATQELHTAGARFSVELEDRGAVQTLFERVLRPQEDAPDRGFQELSVPLPPGATGEIVLRVSYGPGQGDEHAWCCWTAVEIR